MDAPTTPPDEDADELAAIGAVCFDLDSTLCVSTQSDDAIHEAVFERVGAEPFFEPAEVRAVDPATLPPAESRRERLEHLYRRLAAQKDVDTGIAPELAEATLEVFDPTAVELRTGAERALAYAREHYTVGLLTQGRAAPQTAKLERLGITGAFDARVFCGPGTDFPGKPAPEPFEALLGTLGVRPARTVYIGDSLTGDVAGARAAGMAAVWVPTGDRTTDTPDPTPTRRLDSPGEIPEVL